MVEWEFAPTAHGNLPWQQVRQVILFKAVSRRRLNSGALTSLSFDIFDIFDHQRPDPARNQFLNKHRREGVKVSCRVLTSGRGGNRDFGYHLKRMPADLCENWTCT